MILKRQILDEFQHSSGKWKSHCWQKSIKAFQRDIQSSIRYIYLLFLLNFNYQQFDNRLICFLHSQSWLCGGPLGKSSRRLHTGSECFFSGGISNFSSSATFWTGFAFASGGHSCSHCSGSWGWTSMNYWRNSRKHQYLLKTGCHAWEGSASVVALGRYSACCLARTPSDHSASTWSCSTLDSVGEAFEDRCCSTGGN